MRVTALIAKIDGCDVNLAITEKTGSRFGLPKDGITGISRKSVTLLKYSLKVTATSSSLLRILPSSTRRILSSQMVLVLK